MQQRMSENLDGWMTVHSLVYIMCSSLAVLRYGRLVNLPFKRQTKIAADDILSFYLICQRKYDLIFHVNPLPSIGFT